MTWPSVVTADSPSVMRNSGMRLSHSSSTMINSRRARLAPGHLCTPQVHVYVGLRDVVNVELTHEFTWDMRWNLGLAHGYNCDAFRLIRNVARTSRWRLHQRAVRSRNGFNLHRIGRKYASARAS